MSDLQDSLLRQALSLPREARAALADALIASLEDVPEDMHGLWIAEARDRLAGFRAGELEAEDADEVFAALGGHA